MKSQMLWAFFDTRSGAMGCRLVHSPSKLCLIYCITKNLPKFAQKVKAVVMDYIITITLYKYKYLKYTITNPISYLFVSYEDYLMG